MSIQVNNALPAATQTKYGSMKFKFFGPLLSLYYTTPVQAIEIFKSVMEYWGITATTEFDFVNGNCLASRDVKHTKIKRGVLCNEWDRLLKGQIINWVRRRKRIKDGIVFTSVYCWRVYQRKNDSVWSRWRACQTWIFWLESDASDAADGSEKNVEDSFWQIEKISNWEVVTRTEGSNYIVLDLEDWQSSQEVTDLEKFKRCVLYFRSDKVGDGPTHRSMAVTVAK